MSHANRSKLLNVPEIRAARPFECRANADGQLILQGYAATYEPYELLGGPEGGGWVEQIQPTAFDVTLASKPDLMLLINHEGMPLARTSSGTLQLSRDRNGLRVHAMLDRADPDVQRLLPKMKPQANGKSNMDEMSFGFRVRDQIWDNSFTQRTITEINLQHGDVSVVNYGANHTTSAALGMLAELSAQDLVELRGKDPDLLDRALLNLAALRADDPKKPYGDVTYADPKNGKYPVDTEAHARAAWSYIHMPKNRAGYTADELANIEGRIKAALKRFGVDIAEDKKSAPMSIPAAAGLEIVIRNTTPPPDPEEPDTEEPVEEGQSPEAFPGETPITVGPIAAALQSTLSEAYRMAAANDDTCVGLLARATELMSRAQSASRGESEIDHRLGMLRQAGQLPALRSITDALAELARVSSPA